MRRTLALFGLAGVVGCSLTSLDGFSGGESPVDGGAVDGSGDDAGRPDGKTGSAGENLLLGGDFESDAGVTCSKEGFNANLQLNDQNPHRGLSSCRVCGRGLAEATFAIDERLDRAPPTVGLTYRVSAWVRRSMSMGAPTKGVFITLRTYDNGPFTVVEEQSFRLASLTDTWVPISVDLTITKRASGVGMYVAAESETGTCFIVDDLEARRIE